ncbi:hypothetical protein GGS20DRAFT_595304 [Poronia punctata]|nr:hypothetical protein GGS20DRAFT_595304 [Poronia punctata]
MSNLPRGGVHTTGSNPSLRPISNRTNSIRSTASSGAAAYRHALLKSDATEKSFEKDSPIPPVLTHGQPPLPGEKGNPNLGQHTSTDLESRLSRAPSYPGRETPEGVMLPVATVGEDSPVVLDDGVGDGICFPDDGHNHFHSWRLPVSKVRPAVLHEDKPALLYDHNLTIPNHDSGKTDDAHTCPTPSKLPYPVDAHFVTSRMNTPKVRPFKDPTFLQAADPHGAHDATSKVRPFRASSGPAGSEEPSSPVTTGEPRSSSEQGSQKTATYWGFLPRFGGNNRSKERQVPDGKDQNVISDSTGGSSRLSQVGSQKSSIGVQPPSIKSQPRQENIQQDEESSHPSSSVGGRVANQKPGWLGGLIGRSNDAKSPILTKRPEKTLSHRHSSADEVSSQLSRATRYADKTAADKKAMNNAVKDLEKLLAEALLLAHEASGHSAVGHVDDAHLPLTPTSKASVRTASAHESINSDTSEVVEAPSHGGTGCGKDIDDTCQGYSHKPTDPAEHAKVVKGRRLSVKTSSLGRHGDEGSRGKRRRHHTSDDNCVLPMPPLDRQPKRRSVYSSRHGYEEDDAQGGVRICNGGVPNSREVREYIRTFHEPPIGTRNSSKPPHGDENQDSAGHGYPPSSVGSLSRLQHNNVSVCSLDGGPSGEVIDFSTQYSLGEKEQGKTSHAGFRNSSQRGREGSRSIETGKSPRWRRRARSSTRHAHELQNISLRNRSHVSIGEGQKFSLTKSSKRQPTIARDWSPARKRFVAAVACSSTALIGVLIGIYAGLVPSIQYYIADFHHYAILGNVGLYLGMALSNILFWPLPLLHGRKPYIVGGLCTAMPLLFPQAIAVSAPRSPNSHAWRVALLLSRALMGFVLGFASMNFHSMLTDLFGASLMSDNPHQEVVDEYDVRRHGGGFGVWLGTWTWCFIGSISAGFVVGSAVIERLQPSWGFYISIAILLVVLLLNVLCPEVRRSAWRRSVAEVRMGETISRRLARGEVMMHRVQTGPRWWGQEVYHGLALVLEMLRQPGFLILAVYSAWIYAQVVLLVILLGSLASKSYRFRSPYVGLVVASVAVGALVAIPFQKANLFSRSRHRITSSNSMTFDKKPVWSSHLFRRAIFTLVLPVAGIIYTVFSTGPPVHILVPACLAALMGFLSCLAISECNGLLMETWDCSDLQPGMTGRSLSSKDSHKRTNYSSFPRVTAGWNLIQSLGFVLAAVSTAVGGSVTRRLGQRAATGVVAGILLVLTLLLLGVFVRFKRVQIIPDCTCSEMDRWQKERRVSLHNWTAAVAEAKAKGSKALDEIPEDDVG